MPSRPFCLISFLSLEDVSLDCQSKTKLTQPAKNCKIYFNKVKVRTLFEFGIAVLAGKTAWAHGSQLSQLALNSGNAFVNGIEIV